MNGRNVADPFLSPYWKLIGLDEILCKDGISRIELPIKEDLLQRRGTVHGGVIASLIDASIGASIRSCLTDNEGIVTVEMKLNYIRPGTGKLLIGQGKIIHKGRQIATGEAKIVNDEDKVIASGMGTFMIFKK